MKDSFIVRFAVHAWLQSLGARGPLGVLLATIISRIIGDMADRGIIIVDLRLDKIREAMKEDQWKEAATKAYKVATAKVYTEKEKNAIRDQYIRALGEYVGFGVPGNNKNP